MEGVDWTPGTLREGDPPNARPFRRRILSRSPLEDGRVPLEGKGAACTHQRLALPPPSFPPLFRNSPSSAERNGEARPEHSSGSRRTRQDDQTTESVVDGYTTCERLHREQGTVITGITPPSSSLTVMRCALDLTSTPAGDEGGGGPCQRPTPLDKGHGSGARSSVRLRGHPEPERRRDCLRVIALRKVLQRRSPPRLER